MTYIDKKLLKASKNAGNKISLEVGDSFKGTYIGYEQKLDEKYKKNRFHFKFVTAEGVERVLRTNAGKVLAKMAKIEPNSKVVLIKTGEGTQTDYDIEVIGVSKQPAQVKSEDEEETIIDLDNEEDEEEDEEDDDEEAGF